MKPPMPLSEKFCATLESNPTADLAVVLRDICVGHNFTNITYYSPSIPTGEEDEVVLITTYPEAWVSHYFEREYEVVDPVLSAGSRSLLPVDWNGLSKLDGAAGKFFGEAREFGLGESGLTVPVRGVYGEQAMLSLNAECTANEWQSFCRDASSDLFYLAHLIHENVVASRHPPQGVNKQSLTRREADVLRWAARGKTAWETAKILGLSEKTVTFYTGNICTKLKVATKTQAVAKAVRERMILF